MRRNEDTQSDADPLHGFLAVKSVWCDPVARTCLEVFTGASSGATFFRLLCAGALFGKLLMASTLLGWAQDPLYPSTPGLQEVSLRSSASGASPEGGAAEGYVVVASVPAAETDVLTANPGRPAMATSALLTPVGYAQVENGLLYASGSAQFSSRDGLEETVRVTVAPRLQFIVSAEPAAYSATDGGRSTRRGDVDGGLQVVAVPGHGAKPAVSMSYLRLVRGGNATDLDIGGYANSAILMASSDFGHLHVDANGFVNETEGAVRRAQFGQAVALSHPLTAKLSGTAELRHFTEPLNGWNERGDGLSGLGALGYALRPNLVFDLGVVRGFTDSSTHWQVTGGFTHVLPQRVWGLARR